MEQFVCVRLIKTNHLDLGQFQFDHDLTFAVFFMNADGTIYGRYGTRTGMKTAESDVSLKGFAESLARSLTIHENYPDNESALAGKQPVRADVQYPEQFAALDHYKSVLDYQGQVSRSCIHCHQIRDAQRIEYRVRNEPLPLRLLFPFPNPRVLGIRMDARTANRVAAVHDGSVAAASGIRNGDRLVAINRQPIVSTADIQWILERAEDRDRLTIDLLRDGDTESVGLDLPEGWRRKTDLSWRPTSWDLRRMATGGVRSRTLADIRRADLGISESDMALLIDHVGKFGKHAVAHRAGVRKGDIILEFDGQRDLMTESQLLEYAMQKKKPGDTVKIVAQRRNSRRTFEIRLQ